VTSSLDGLQLAIQIDESLLEGAGAGGREKKANAGEGKKEKLLSTAGRLKGGSEEISSTGGDKTKTNSACCVSEVTS